MAKVLGLKTLCFRTTFALSFVTVLRAAEVNLPAHDLGISTSSVVPQFAQEALPGFPLQQPQFQQQVQLVEPQQPPAIAFPVQSSVQPVVAQIQSVVPGSDQEVPSAGTPFVAVPPAPVVSTEIDVNDINVDEVAAQVDKGKLPATNVLRAIFSASSKLGKKLPAAIRDLKDHLLDRIINHNKMLMQAMELQEDSIMKEIAAGIDNKKRRKQSSNADYVKVPKLPLIVGYDPFLRKPKPSFFGRIRGWFGGDSKPEVNVGVYKDNDQTPQNSFGLEGEAWGRSTVYYPPLQYSSHLIPLTSGAFDLKTFQFRSYRPGHPKLAQKRIVTHIITGHRKPKPQKQPKNNQKSKKTKPNKNID